MKSMTARKLSLILCLAILALFSACSESSPTESSPGESSDGLLRVSYPITVDESQQVFNAFLAAPARLCVLTDSTASWEPNPYGDSIQMDYSFKDGMLLVTLFDTTLFLSGETSGKSPYGVWNPGLDCQLYEGGEPQCASFDKTHPIEISRDSLYTFGEDPSREINLKETEINLYRSDFTYDVFRCLSESHYCNFGQWHFTQSKFSQDYITLKDVSNRTNNSYTATFNGQEFTVTAETVLEDSLNHGYGKYLASVQSNGKTCHYRHIKAFVSEKNCTAENLPYFMVMGSEEDNFYAADFYYEDNSEEFANCLVNLVK